MSRAWHIFARILTIVLGVVLIDAAVETALAGSNVRWAAIGAAVAYVLVSIALRRLDAGTLAALGAAALGAILAFDNWSDGTLGAAGGAKVFGQSADLAAGALATVLLLAVGVAIASLRLMPLVLRFLAIVIVAYALVPLATSLAHGAGLTDALGANAPFFRDPRWLDGAFLAATVIFPIAALGSLAGGVVYFTRKRPALGMRLTALAAALAVATQVTGLEAATNGLPDPIAFHNPDAAAIAAAETTHSGALFQSAFATSPPAAAGASASAGAPTAPAGSPGATASQGATTTASSTDATALAKICVPDPTASARVGAAAAVGLKDAMGAFAGNTPAPSPTPNPYEVVAQRYRALARRIPCDDYDIAGLASQLPNDPGAIDVFVRDHIALELYSGAMRGASGTWIARSGNVIDRAILLNKLLAAKNIPSRFAMTTLADDDLKALDGQRSVKPQPYAPATIPGASPAATNDGDVAQGRTRAQTLVSGAEQRSQKVLASLASGGVSLTSDVPPTMELFRHHLWVQVAVNDKLVDLDPSLSSLQPGAHLGGAAQSTPKNPPDEICATLTAKIVAEYGSDASPSTVVLTDIDGKLADLGTKPVLAGIVSNQTNADPATLRSLTTLTAALGAGDYFSKSQDFSFDDPAKGKLRSLRLEITTTQPGLPDRKYVRWILAPADRNESDLALHLVGVHALLVQTAPYSPWFVAAKTMSAAITLAENAAHPDATGNELVYPARASSFFYADNALASAVTAKDNATLQIDRPRIAMESWGFMPSGTGIVPTISFDIVDNALASYGQDGAKANVALGVLDTELEHDALGPDAFGSLEALDAGGSALTVLRKAPSDQGQYLGLQQSFDRGGVALAMNAPTTIRGQSIWSWWDVDPHGGATVGRSSGGAGASMGEYAAVLGNILSTVGSALQAKHDCGSGGNPGACACDVMAVVAGVLGTGLAGGVAAGAITGVTAGQAGGAGALVAGGAGLCSGLRASRPAPGPDRLMAIAPDLFVDDYGERG